MYYIAYVFEMAGYSGNANLLASSIQYIINVVMTVPGLLFMDFWGRRSTLLAGFCLMLIWMYANAGIAATHARIIPEDQRTAQEVSMSLSGPPAKGLIACTYLFVASYAPTVGPASWAYPPELFPLDLRGKGVSLSTSANWLFNMALGLFTPVAFGSIMWKTYIIFGVFNTAAFIHTFLLFPETAGKTLEEVENIFEDPNGIKYIGTPAWKTKVKTHHTRALEKGKFDLEKADHPVPTTAHLDEKPLTPLGDTPSPPSETPAVNTASPPIRDNARIVAAAHAAASGNNSGTTTPSP